ncbi:hypothetical protein ACFSBZ_07475 [Amnibacterium flavum]|uniref:Uncharacterized protein n=1 Tax=Amnibacterium flavum TaxID=2173173 RepID=A0A2V1HMN4_9MICO|nr:hypothetical protein [Amnibacterium flavum]PVZ93735.1 hypothetical protein DDQ50_08025 [Amnibacterium flavum]
MPTAGDGTPTWRSIGRETRGEVLRLAKAGKIHPDPAIAALAYHWSHRPSEDRFANQISGAILLVGTVLALLGFVASSNAVVLVVGVGVTLIVVVAMRRQEAGVAASIRSAYPDTYLLQGGRDEFDGGQLPPPVGAELAERQRLVLDLAEAAWQQVREHASVDFLTDDGRPVVSVEPHKADAAGFWMVADHALNIQIGQSRARWSLRVSPESEALSAAMLQAVIAGRVDETRALGRVAVTVHLADGRELSALADESTVGFLKVPGWRRWGRTREFAPYS